MNNQTIRKVMIGLVTIIALTMGIVAATSSVTAQESGELSLENSDISIPQGEEKTIAVTYDGNVEPAGFQYILTYDPDVITVKDHSNGDYFAASIQPDISNGKVDYFSPGSADGTSGTVSELTVIPARGAETGATTDIRFSDERETKGSTTEGGGITLTTTGGTVQVEAGTPIEDKVGGLTEPTDELDFDDLNTAIQRYQNDEPVDGTELTFDDLVYLIELYHNQ